MLEPSGSPCGTKRHGVDADQSISICPRKRLMFTRPLGQRLTAAAIGLNGTLEGAHHRRAWFKRSLLEC